MAEQSTLLDGPDFRPIKVSQARGYIKRHHYSHAFPRVTPFNFGYFQDGILTGVAAFNLVPERWLGRFPGVQWGEAFELARLHCLDDTPPNTESRFIGWCLRCLRSVGTKLIISFADPTEGHRGTIYQATNFVYTGISNNGSGVMVGGVALHPLRARGKYGTSNPRKIPGGGSFEIPGKHRYIIALGHPKECRKIYEAMGYEALPYPKEDHHG